MILRDQAAHAPYLVRRWWRVTVIIMAISRCPIRRSLPVSSCLAIPSGLVPIMMVWMLNDHRCRRSRRWRSLLAASKSEQSGG